MFSVYMPNIWIFSDKQQTFSNFLNTNQSCRKRKWEVRRRQKPFFIICPARGPGSICRRRLSNCAPHRRGQEARRQRRTPGREAPRSGLRILHRCGAAEDLTVAFEDLPCELHSSVDIEVAESLLLCGQFHILLCIFVHGVSLGRIGVCTAGC